MSELNREEILFLLRKHIGTLAALLEPQNNVPKNVLLEGGGSENRGGLNRINELMALLKDAPPYQGGGE